VTKTGTSSYQQKARQTKTSASRKFTVYNVLPYVDFPRFARVFDTFYRSQEFKISVVSLVILTQSEGMAKQVLGRSLGALMDDGAKEAAKTDPSNPQPTPVSAGVRSLMRGNQPTPATTTATAIESKQKLTVPRWYLFGGDFLLAALALIVVCKSRHPLSWQREVFCGIAVVLGACLAITALMQPEDK
jgi:hypothetical protein